MSIYNAQQLISASNATYFTNTSGSITAADVRGLNDNWISSSALLSGSNTFIGNQTISGSLTAQLQANYIWLGNSSGYSQAVATSSISLQGAQGIQGLQGTQGTQGTQGIQGVQGTSGSQGLQGIQGISGSQGLQGIQGISGSQGLQGIQGITGITGSQGIQGTQGFQGVQGLQGISGSIGISGSQGLQGIQGTQGIQGITGITGSQGVQGIQGFQGVQGLQGISGSNGVSGSQGVQGITGASGSQGTQGSGVSSGSLLVTASFANTNITFTKGDATTFDLPGFATTGSNTFTGNNTFNADINANRIFFPNGSSLIGDSGSRFVTDSNTGIELRNFNTSEFYIQQNANAGLYLENNVAGIAISGSFTQIQNVDFIPFSASLNSRINAITGSGGTINTGSFATTGSNTFVGQQILSNTGDLQFPLQIISGGIRIDVNDGNDWMIYNGNVNGGLKTTGNNLQLLSQTGSLEISNTAGAITISGSSTTIQEVDFIPFSASLNTRILAVTGSSINTGSFATTGSNTFNGTQNISGSIVINSANDGETFLIYRNGQPTQNWQFGITSPGNSFLKTRNRTWVQNDGIDGELMIHYLPTKFENGIYTQGSQLSITGSVVIAGNLTASLQQGYAWVGNGSNVSSLVATSSFGSGGTINTGSFATTGSNQFNGNQTITGSLYAGVIGQRNGLNGQTVITGSLIVSGSGNTFIGNQIVSGNIDITGQYLVNGVPISGGASINTGSFATTGSNTFTGNQVISGSLDVLNTFTASLANGYTYVGNSNNRTTLVATSSFGGTTNTGSLMVTGSVSGNVLTFTKGDASTFSLTVATGSGGTIATGSFITTGSANSQQFISGNIGINRIYAPTTASIAPTLNTYGSNSTTILFNYNDIIYSVSPNIYDITGKYSLWPNWKVNGTGVTNGTISNMQYGNDGIEVTINQTATNNQSYSLIGPWSSTLTIDSGYAPYTIISGGLQVNTNGHELQLFGGAANSVIFTSQTEQSGGGLNQFIWNVTMLTASYASFNIQNSDNVQNGFNLGRPNTSPLPGQDIWQLYGGGESNFGGGDNSIFIAPVNSSKLYGYKNIELTGSLNISNTFTASLANGYTWVGGSNNKTKLVATSSFTSQGVQGFAGQSGSQGLQGTGGSQGATTQGAQGISGSQGPQGISVQGAPGQSITGQSGSQGPQGTSGTGGQQGVSGSQGIQGVQGATGTNGYGYQGLNTTASLTLQTGTITFTTNTNVTSNAFQTGNRIRLARQADPTVYWEEGVITAYTTNQMTVLIDLVNVSGGTFSGYDIGITGQQGNIGLQGIQGTNGQQGTQGIQGAQGAGGAGGQQGTQGATGTGTQGATGTGTQGATGTGTQGATGSQGITGTGSQGAAGGQGLQGFIGGAGQQGSQGATGGTGGVGNQGAAGSNGSNGAQGATGAQGTTGTTGTGFSTISPANNNALVISNGTSNSATTNSSIYVSGNTIYADAFYQNSSRLLKTNIIAFDEDAIALLKRVSVVTFYYKNDTFTPHIGFIAEDTPQELSGINQNMMDVPSVVGTLIKAVQQLQAQNDSLVARIEALENK